MKKLLIVGMIGAVALFVIAKKTHTFSYVSTLCSSITRDASDAVPTKFELERIRNEIANLDSDVGNMIRPIAEYKADIERLRKDINKNTASMEDRKKDLLAVVERLDAAEKADKGFVVLPNNKRFPVEKVKAQLQRETENVKLSEKNLKTQQQVLEAKEASLKATQEQLAKVVSKKREYELRVAQLEAMDQTLQVARIGTIKIDANRAAQIEEALQNLEKRLQTDGEELIIRNNQGGINLFEREPDPVDLSTLRTYLQGGEQTEKASNR
jgi:chromosome segregation ATPase